MEDSMIQKGRVPITGCLKGDRTQISSVVEIDLSIMTTVRAITANPR